MNRKRTFVVGLALVGVLALGVGAVAAQGSRGGQRGGRGGAANGAAAGQRLNQQLGTRQQLQIHDPLTGGLATGTGNQFGRGGQGRGQGLNLGNQYLTMPPFEGELPADVSAAVLAGLTDELNAAATYEAVLAQFGSVAPFSSILQAEYSHAAALESALDYYGVDYSAIAPTVTAPTFASVSEACAIAAEAEIANFGLYDSWIATVSDYPDLVQVFTNLRDASEFNHLPAFQNCAG